MYDIYHDFPIHAPAVSVFAAVTTPEGLNQWWTLKAAGKPEKGSVYSLYFGPKYDWKAVLTHCEPNRQVEWQMTDADEEWTGTRVGFRLEEKGPSKTQVNFYHSGWPALSENFRVSSYCWAMYLRILRRYLEFGEQVPYASRLNV